MEITGYGEQLMLKLFCTRVFCIWFRCMGKEAIINVQVLKFEGAMEDVSAKISFWIERKHFWDSLKNPVR